MYPPGVARCDLTAPPVSGCGVMEDSHWRFLSVGRSRAVKLASHESGGESQIWEQAAINTQHESKCVPWTQCGEDIWLTLSPVRRKTPHSLCCHNNSQETRCLCDLSLILEDQMFSGWINQIIIRYHSRSEIYCVSLSSFLQCNEAGLSSSVIFVCSAGV